MTDETCLSKVDIYGKPEQLQYKGKSSYRTSTGGILTVAALLLCGSALVSKVFSGPSSSTSAEDPASFNINLIETSSTNLTAANQTISPKVSLNEQLKQFGADFYSENNFKFLEQQLKDLDVSTYTSPLSVKDNGISDVAIIFQQADIRDTVESAMVYWDTTDEVQVAMLKERQKNFQDKMDDYGKYLRFKIENTYLKGKNSKGDGKDYKTSKEYTSADITLTDGKNFFPKLYIGDQISLMGDYTQEDLTQMRAYTTFAVKLDYVNIMKEALENTIEYKDDTEKIADITQRTRADTKGVDKTFTEKHEDDLIKDWISDQPSYTSTFYDELEEYKAKLKKDIDHEKEIQQLDLKSSAYYTKNAEFFDSIKAYEDQEWVVSYKGNGTSQALNFVDVFNGHVLKLIDEISTGVSSSGSGTFNDGLFDSLAVQVYEKGQTNPKTVTLQ